MSKVLVLLKHSLQSLILLLLTTHMHNNKIIRFVVWICSKFSKIEIEQIISELTKILSNQNPEIKPKDSVKQELPNYQKFDVDPKPPIKAVKKNS